MKKILSILLTIFLLPCLAACSASVSEQDNGDTTSGNENGSHTTTSTANNVLIAYFSCTGTTENIAEIIADETGGTLYEIVAADPYTEEDLQYYTGGRCDQEQADSSARPAISGNVENMDSFDIIFLGYPIWHRE